VQTQPVAGVVIELAGRQSPDAPEAAASSRHAASYGAWGFLRHVAT
jgi:hypothetical protein